MRFVWSIHFEMGFISVLQINLIFRFLQAKQLLRLIEDSYEFIGSQHINYEVTSLENTPQPMQLCFYFTLSAKKLFQWIFSWLSPFFQRKTWDAYNFLDTDTTFANFFVRSQPNYLKLFCAKKHPKKEIQHPHDCFCNLESWNKGA